MSTFLRKEKKSNKSASLADQFPTGKIPEKKQCGGVCFDHIALHFEWRFNKNALLLYYYYFLRVSIQGCLFVAKHPTTETLWQLAARDYPYHCDW